MSQFQEISAIIPDWSREQLMNWAPGRALLKTIRDYQRVTATGRKRVC